MHRFLIISTTFVLLLGFALSACTPPGATIVPEEPNAESLTRLVVYTRPQGCVVKVNGIKIPGVTPMEDLTVVPGRKHVVVVNCIGHEREVRTVTGRAGEVLTLDFTPARKQ